MNPRLRHRPMLVVVLTAPLVLGGCGGAGRPGTPPLHVVLVTVEGLRADHVTAYGYARETTYLRQQGVQQPRDLDLLIDSGVRFDGAFAPTGRFRPTAATLMTGMSPLEHGVLDASGALDPEIPTLAERFADAGFATAAFLSSTVALEDAGLRRGFDVFAERLPDPKMLLGAVDWLRRNAGGEKPLFLWLHFGGIAPPFEGEALVDRFSERDYAGPLTGDFDFRAAWSAGEIEDTPANRARLLDLYDGEVQRVGKALASFYWYYSFELAQHALWEQTLFVFAGTSGMELAERGAPNGEIGNGETLVDVGLRVPLAFRHPASLTGHRIFDEVVELADVPVTLEDWFELPSAARASGRSLLALTDSYVKREFASRPALAVRIEGGEITGRSLRDSRWRAIFEGERAELYEVAGDPKSRRDVAELYPWAVDEMRAELEAVPGGADGP